MEEVLRTIFFGPYYTCRAVWGRKGEKGGVEDVRRYGEVHKHRKDIYGQVEMLLRSCLRMVCTKAEKENNTHSQHTAKVRWPHPPQRRSKVMMTAEALSVCPGCHRCWGAR
ncbi:unnamed protein product [Lota lota]